MPRKPGYHYRSLAGTTEWVRPSSYIGEEDESARPARVNNQEQLDKQIAEEGYYYRSINLLAIGSIGLVFPFEH